MLGGYAGKMLFVDLGNGSIREEVLPEEICRDFIGGYGLGIRILYERMRPRVEPFSGDNMLASLQECLRQLRFREAAGYGVVTKSPLTGAGMNPTLEALLAGTEDRGYMRFSSAVFHPGPSIC